MNNIEENDIMNIDFSIDKIVLPFFDIAEKPNWSYNPPKANHATISLITEGGANFYINNKFYNVKKGDIIFRNFQTDFHSSASEKKFEYFCVYFRAVDYSPFNLLKNVYKIKNYDYFYDLFFRLVTAYKKKNYAYILKTKSLLYEIFRSLIIEDVNIGTRNNKYNIIKASVLYMEKNLYDTALSIDKIAEQSGITATYFRKIFNEIYAVSPLKYITEKRLDKATSLLYYSNMNINEISHMVGYNSSVYFDKVFKKKFGRSPLEFKKNSF